MVPSNTPIKVVVIIAAITRARRPQSFVAGLTVRERHHLSSEKSVWMTKL
ncbi:hypothetical protein MJ561_24210 [Klebsiella pneumoniae]|nr:hypothetical protein MJ561_24210 [Klebsiella pneumoniae]